MTLGALFDNQFEDWLQNDRSLNIEDYEATLWPVDGYYEIDDAMGIKDLLGFAANDEYEFRLAGDIDLSEDDGLYIPYIEADFDGDNYTISDLNVDMSFGYHVGMFGYVAEDVSISNVVISNSSVTGNRYIGGLAGINHGKISTSTYSGELDGAWYIGGLSGLNHGIISSSSSAGDLTGTGSYIGGSIGENIGTLSDSSSTVVVFSTHTGQTHIGGSIGRNSGTVENSFAAGEVDAVYHDQAGGLIGTNAGTVSNSYATGTVSGNERVGGLVGYNTGPVIYSYSESQVTGESDVGGLVGHIHSSSGTVSQSYSTGGVTGTGNNVGGLVGYIYIGEWVHFDLRNDGMVENSYSTGNVTGDWNVGGLIGHIDTGSVFNSYSVGTADGENRVGGLVGYSRLDGTVENSFWDVNTSGLEESDGGVGKTTEEMMDISTFSGVEWDIAAVEHQELRNLDHLWNIVVTETYPFFSWEDSELIEIWTWEDLHNARYNMTGIYSLMTDLTPECEGYDDYASDNADDGSGWLPIGGWDDSFSGTFDGQGNTISGLYIDRPDTDYVGLFGYLDESEVRNVGLIEANVSGRDRVSALVGWNDDDVIVSDSYATGTVSGNSAVGGLVGWNDGTVSGSHATGDVSGADEIGGLIGYNGGEIINSYSAGTTTGESMIGGLVGYNEWSTIEDSFSRGDVTRRAGSDDTDIGGFVGFNEEGRIINCYSTGFVGVEDGDELTENGFAGNIEDEFDYEMTGNFWDVDTSGQTDTSGDATGLPTSEMMNMTTFTNADWDFEYIWWMVEDEYYPLLSWQGPVYNVDSRGTFDKISDALPSTDDGDTVLVSSGTYKENVILSRHIRLIGSGMDESIIDAQGDGFGILVMANNTLVRGFTLMNATNDDPGAGIVLVDPGNGGGEGPPEDPHPLVNCTIDQVRSTDNNHSVVMINVHESAVTNSELTNSTDFDLFLMDSHKNTVEDNTLKNGEAGIVLIGSHENEIRGNDASSHFISIVLEGSDNNILDENKISDNVRTGIHLDSSVSNVLTNNIMEETSINIEGDEVGYWNTHEIDESNTVNGSPVIYLKDQNGQEITGDEDIGQLILANCEEITIDGLELSKTKDSILIGFSNDLTITNNKLHDNHNALYLFLSEDNTIEGNEFLNNDAGMVVVLLENNTIVDNLFSENDNGIIMVESKDNLIYHNAFINNDRHAHLIDVGGNSWDAGYSTGGNYWDDHTEPDEYGGEDQDEPGSDGIVDDEREIEGDDNVDNYPWTNPHFELQIVVSNPEPEDGEDEVPLDTTLSVYVEADGHPTEVTFYLNGDEIYSDTITEDGQVISDALDLDHETGYEWHVIATNDDGNNYTRTPDHSFTTLSIYELTIGDIIGQGTIEVDGVDVYVGWSNEFSDGSEVSLIADANDGWEFVEWSGDTVNIGDVNSATTTIVMEDDYTITANFELTEHELTIDSTDGGEVTNPGEGTFSYNHGTQVGLTAQPDTYYRFVQWTGDTDEIDDIYSASTHIIMNDDYSLTAVFEVDQEFNLNIGSTQGGQVTDPGEGFYTYDYGTVVDLVAEADDGWEFVRWDGEVGEIDDVNSATTTITMNYHYSITAVFEEIIEMYDLTVEIEGDGSVDISSSQPPVDDKYIEGTWVDLTAVPEDGWIFSHWSGDVQEGQEEYDYINIYMDDDKTLTAHFEEVGFEPGNLILDVYPTSGEVPLEVTIYVYAENFGEEPGSIDVFVNGRVEYTLQIPAQDSAEHTLTHTFERSGIFEIEFHDLTQTVNVGDVPEFEPENIELFIEQTYGEAPLETSIFVKAENFGDTAGSIDVIINGRVVYTLQVPANDIAEYEFTHIFEEVGTYRIEFHDETRFVEVYDPESFAPVNLELDVDPVLGEPPLTVNIYVSAENVGEEHGSIDVVIDGTIVYTLDLPPQSIEDHSFTHTFGEIGQYNIEFRHLSETVTVSVEQLTIEITSPVEDSIFNIGDVTIEWDSEGTISHHEISINDGPWLNIGLITYYTFPDLEDGDHTVQVKVVSTTGDEEIISLDFTVDSEDEESTETELPMWAMALIGILVFGLIVVLVSIVFVMRKGKEKTSPKPTEESEEKEEAEI